MTAKTAFMMAKEALEVLEWTPNVNIASPFCYWCKGYQRAPSMDQDYYGKAGHKPDCKRQLALAAIEEVLRK